MAAPTAISQDRIAATLKSMGVQYFREDSGEVRTAFPSLMVFFEVAEGGFKATARWLGIIEGDDIETVSYTHLTLPTKPYGCRSRWSPYH